MGSSHLILTISLWCWYSYKHFTDAKTKSWGTCLRSHIQYMAEPASFRPRSACLTPQPALLHGFSCWYLLVWRGIHLQSIHFSHGNYITHFFILGWADTPYNESYLLYQWLRCHLRGHRSFMLRPMLFRLSPWNPAVTELFPDFSL